MKIALFISDVHQPFGKQIIKTMESYARERGVELHVFASFGLQDNNLLHAEGEKSILYLANLDNYQCIMVAGDTMARYDMHDELVAHLERNAKCPVLGIRHEEAGKYNVLVHNQAAMYEVTKHFLYEHRMKKVCFVTGRMNSPDAKERLDGYLDAMNEAGIEVEDRMIFEGDYWRNKGPEILDYFLKGYDGSLPEAIVFSNDYMALSVCDELIKRGYKIPDDICISGFDDLEEAQMYLPPLTTVKVPFENMARAALGMAIDLANGDVVPKIRWIESKVRYRGSCGCNKDSVSFNKDIYHRQMMQVRYMTKQAIYMQSDSGRASTEEECFDFAKRYLRGMPVDRYYICLKRQDISEEELERYFERARELSPKARVEAAEKRDRMVSLRRVVSADGTEIEEDILFDKQDILPEKYEKELQGTASIIAPIHSQNETYGYFIFQMSDEPEAVPDEKFELLCMYFGDTLRRIYMHQNLLSVRDAMHLYLRDPLTNLYNRRGFEQNYVHISDWAKKENVKLAMVSLDMDGLKYINDHFGHKIGDEALVGISRALEESIRENEICARSGGDEFEAILILDEPDRIEKFRDSFAQKVAALNAAIEEDYIIEASVGICVEETSIPLKECMHQADIIMYEEKRKRKKQAGVRFYNAQ